MREHAGQPAIHHPGDARTVTIAVLAGGRSQRFGSDKAQAPFAGRPMLDRILDCACAVSERVLVVGRTRLPSFRPGVDCLLDLAADQGPLGGLHTALVSADGPVLLLGCDTPAISVGILHWLITTWRSGPLGSGVLPMIDRQPQRTLALYPRQSATPCRQALARGDRSLREIARPGLMRPLQVPEGLAWRFANCNTPDALARLEHQLVYGGEIQA